MKKLIILPFLLTLFFIITPVCSAFFTSSYDLRGTLPDDSEAFFIGKTTISGTCAGYPMEFLTNSSLVQGMEGFPYIGEITLAHLDSVIVAENIDITTAESLEDLLVQYYDHLSYYSDVDLVTEEGLFLLGIQKGTMTITADLPYAVSTFVSLDMIQDTPTRVYITGMSSPLLVDYTGDFAVLVTLSDTSTIHVRDTNGRSRWSGGSPNDYLLIQDTSFSVKQHPPMSLLPWSTMSEDTHLNLSITPSESEDIKLQQLIENVSVVIETNLQDGSPSDFLRSLNELDTFIHTASFIANGAMVLLQTNDTMTIDYSTQQFSSVGFVRFNTLEITNVQSALGPTLRADCLLTFLGNHFYTSQAKQSQDGIRFPFELILIWILAIGVFVYVRFFMRPSVDDAKDDRIRRYALFVHIACLIISFLLLDVEIHSIFGISALTALFLQGLTMVTGVFFAIEAVIWILGFFILAIPVQLLASSLLRFRGIGKGGNGIWKAVGDLSIWVFCGLYLLLFLNILLSLFNFNGLFPMG
ncbi:MAG: hypothetical protein JW840_00720 [Candidatus Thermoplasmatota archaeon]|nr:hypothetical protein [Candidatus Thermoplasmatota archaeon]